MESFIEHFGYLAVLAGTFLEGETFLVLAGFAAHRGYLDLPIVILTAFLGSFSGDQLYYYLGRRNLQKPRLLRPSWQTKIARVRELIERHRCSLIMGFRFFYGLRTVTPFVLGMSGIPPRRFVPLNLFGALLWSVVVGSAGYLFGQAFEAFFGNLKTIELWVMLGIAMLGGFIWLIRSLSGKSGKSD